MKKYGNYTRINSFTPLSKLCLSLIPCSPYPFSLDSILYDIKRFSYRISWKSDRLLIRWYYVTDGRGCTQGFLFLLCKEGLKTRTCVWSTANSSRQNVINMWCASFCLQSTPRIILASTTTENRYKREASLLKRSAGELQRVTVPLRYSVPTGDHH